MLSPSNDVERSRIWKDAIELWLNRQGSLNTAASYRTALVGVLSYTRKRPWELSRRDINAWIVSMQKKELANSTIALRVSAVRAFYRFVITDYILTGIEDGNEYRLREDNPAEGCRPPKVERYGRAVCLDRDQAVALLQAIKTDTLVGLRNKALFAGYMLLGLRNSELRLLKHEDIEVHRDGIYMRYRAKGGRMLTKEIFPPVYEAMMAFAEATGRSEGYVFHGFDNKGEPVNRPITDQTVRNALKYYAQQAGLRTQDLRVHSLRHTAAILRKEAGDSDENIQKFLKHGNVATTKIYLQHLKPDPDKTWMTVAEMLEMVR